MSSTASLKEKTAKGLFWGGISNSVQQILGAVFGLITARILNAEDYGLIGMLAVFSGIVIVERKLRHTHCSNGSKKVLALVV